MSFAAGFYTFSFTINHLERSLYEQLRVKTPVHPEEPLEHLAARALVLCHGYEEGLEFSGGFFEPSQPALWRRNALNEVESWIEIGTPDRRRLERALRLDSLRRIVVYLRGRDEVLSFCHMMRGSTRNCIANIRFYLLDPAALDAIAARLSSRNDWVVTIADSAVFLTLPSGEIETTIPELDMWAEYQHSLSLSDR